MTGELTDFAHEKGDVKFREVFSQSGVQRRGFSGFGAVGEGDIFPRSAPFHFGLMIDATGVTMLGASS